MPGSGKSSLATEMSNISGLKHIDSDAFIENKYNSSINEIFNKSGENKFREYEHKALKEILKEDNIILSTGGGMPCYYDNIDVMNNAGITVYLKTSAQTSKKRLLNNSTERPLIKDKSNKEIKEYLDAILKDREQFYLKAKYIVDTEKSIEEILKLLPFNY